ncbi:MAG: hypothetical protein RIT27_1059 [Pseudomonadota bacterium]|jgi:F0F1-type ATP synthase delta subunit
MKFIALLLIVANVGFFYFHEEIIQTPAQFDLMPLPQDVPQLKLVKEIKAESPHTTASIDSPKIPENPNAENTETISEIQATQEVALAQMDTATNNDPIKMASQAFEVLKDLKTEADRMTTTIDQAVTTPPTTIIPADQKATESSSGSKTVDAAKPVEKLEKTDKIAESPKTLEKTQQISDTLPKSLEETKSVQIPSAIEKNVEPVKLVEMPTESKSTLSAPTKKTSLVSDKKIDPKKEDNHNKTDSEDDKKCFYSGIYEKKTDANKARQWLEKQKVTSKVKDWKNRVKSGRVIYLPAANQSVAKKLSKKLAAKKVKGYALVRNEKGGYLINLGTFRSEKTLQNRLNELKKKGFHGLKVQDRYLEVSVFRLKIEAKTAQKSILEDFSSTFKVPKPQTIACE